MSLIWLLVHAQGAEIHGKLFSYLSLSALITDQDLKFLFDVKSLQMSDKLKMLLNPNLTMTLQPSLLKYTGNANIDEDQKSVAMKVTTDCVVHLYSPNVIVIDAGPGTGKSTTIVNTILEIFKQGTTMFNRTITIMVYSSSIMNTNKIALQFLELASSDGNIKYSISNIFYQLIYAHFSTEFYNRNILNNTRKSRCLNVCLGDISRSAQSIGPKSFMKNFDVIFATFNQGEISVLDRKVDIVIIDDAEKIHDMMLVMLLQSGIKKLILAVSWMSEVLYKYLIIIY